MRGPRIDKENKEKPSKSQCLSAEVQVISEFPSSPHCLEMPQSVSFIPYQHTVTKSVGQKKAISLPPPGRNWLFTLTNINNDS